MNKMTLFAISTVFCFSSAYSISAVAVDKCGGFTSKGDPFPCCTGKGTNDANCTWWAWKKAKDQWGEAPVSSGNAGTWSGKKGKNFSVSTDARSPSVVEFGSHVAWVESVFNSCDKKGKNCVKKITVSEMNCFKPYQAQGSATYTASGKNYIYKK